MESLEFVLSVHGPALRAATELSSRQRARFATVSEPTARGVSEVVLLARSLRAFGGSQANADIRAYFVDHIPADAVSRLTELGVDLRVADRFCEECPHANKLAMFADVEDYDYLVALDTDVVVVGDIVEYLVGDSVGVRMGSTDLLGTPVWRKLYKHFGLAEPVDRHTSFVSVTEMIAPYNNSGVLVVASQHVDALRKSWGDWTLRLIQARSAIPELGGENAYFTDQISLAMALVDSGLPRRPLPLAMNFQSHMPTHPVHEPESVTPLLLHHHHRWTDEGLTPAVYPRCNDAIARVNRVLFGSGQDAHPSDRRRSAAGRRHDGGSRAKQHAGSAGESDRGSASPQPV